MTVVVDTNVILIANRQHGGVGEQCVARCARRLEAIMANGRVAIDDRYRILNEYQHKTQPHVGKRAGDVFVKWILRNNTNAAKCDQIELVEHTDRTFETFPTDGRLEDFDRADRKFVAVAAAHPGSPPILQAADAKWVGWEPILNESGVIVDFLCRDDIQSFRKGKVT